MNAGRFDRRIEIQVRVATRGNSGDPVYTWTTFCIPWANVREGEGVETVQGDKKEASTSTLFTIRFRSDIKNAMRVLYQDEYYNIEGIREITRRGYLEIRGRVAKA